MRRPPPPARALLLGLLTGLTSGCAKVNPTGWWRWTELRLETDGHTDVQDDVGTMEFTDDGGGSLTVVCRYGLFPGGTTAGGGADGAEALDWTVPLPRPELYWGSWAEGDETTLSLNFPTFSWTEIPLVEGHSGQMVFAADEVWIIDQPVNLRITLEP